jgi:hypothetical protein
VHKSIVTAFEQGLLEKTSIKLKSNGSAVSRDRLLAEVIGAAR